MRRRLAVLLMAGAFLLAAAGDSPAAPALDGTFTVSGMPNRLATGPDGNVWFTLDGSSANKEFGRIAPDGTVDEFDSPGALTLAGITGGPDGKLYATATNNIVQIDPANPAGATAFNDNNIGGGSDITTGPDNHLWTGSGANVFEIALPPAPPFEKHTTVLTATSQPKGITAGGDGNLWIDDFNGADSAIIRFDTAGTLLKSTKIGGGPQGIAAGPAGQLAFTNPGASPEEIGRIDYDGNVQTTPFATPPDPFGIVFGNDEAYWIPEFAVNGLARFTPSGDHTVPIDFGGGAGPRYIARGTNDTLWVGLLTAQKIARITGVSPPPPGSAPTTPGGTTGTLGGPGGLVVRFPGMRLAVFAFTVRKKAVTIPIPCPAGFGNCVGAITLRTASKVLPPKALAARKKRKTILKLGSARFSIPAGTTKNVKVKLSKKALKLIAKKRKVKAVATITATAGGTTKTTKPKITIKAQKKKRGR